MFYNHQLRTSLQEWRNRFLKSDYDTFNNKLKFLFDKIKGEPIINNLLADLLTNFPFPKETIKEMIYDRNSEFEFESEEESAAFNYQHIMYLLEEVKDPRYSFGMGVKETLEHIKDNMVTPIFEYLHDQLDDISYVLYIIEKYKLKTEWFTGKELINRYKQLKSNFENLLEDDLRLFLFEQGIDYPFSTPKSTSGRADVVSLIDTNDPLVLEIKIYDSEKGYRKDRIISGFAQIVKYSNDYHKNTGYLVVFNLDATEIIITGAETDKHWPNRYLFNGKTYYIIFINLNNGVSASKIGKLKTESISFEELTSEIV